MSKKSPVIRKRPVSPSAQRGPGTDADADVDAAPVGVDPRKAALERARAKRINSQAGQDYAPAMTAAFRAQIYPQFKGWVVGAGVQRDSKFDKGYFDLLIDEVPATASNVIVSNDNPVEPVHLVWPIVSQKVGGASSGGGGGGGGGVSGGSGGAGSYERKMMTNPCFTILSRVQRISLPLQNIKGEVTGVLPSMGDYVIARDVEPKIGAKDGRTCYMETRNLSLCGKQPPHSERAGRLLQHLQFHGPTAASIFDGMAESIGGVEALLADDACSGALALEGVQDARRAGNAGLAKGFTDLVSRIPEKEQDAEIKRENARGYAATVACGDFDTLSISSQEKLTVALVLSGTARVGAGDEDGSDIRIRSLEEVGPSFDKLPSRYVVNTLAPTGWESTKMLIIMHIVSQFVPNKQVAQDGLCQDPPDDSGVVITKASADEVAATALHCVKMMHTDVSNRLAIGYSPHYDLFVERYMKTGQLPFAAFGRVSRRDPGSNEALDGFIANSMMFDVVGLLEKAGIRVSAQWMVDRITTGGNGFFRALGEESGIKYVHNAKISERSRFTASGFANLLEVGLPLADIQQEAASMGCEIRCYVLPLVDAPNDIDKIESDEAGEAMVDLMMGGSTKKSRDWFAKGGAVPYMVMAKPRA